MSIFRLPVGRITAAYFQSPHPRPDLDPAPAIISAFDSAKQEIHFAIYSLTHQGITDALVRAKQRGVDVIGVVDVHQAQGPTSKVQLLVAAGIDVVAWGGNFRLMHDKAFVLDPGSTRCKVGLGSFNWTTQAEKSNIEVLLIASGTQVSKALGPALLMQIDTAHAAGTSLSIAT